MRQLKATQNNQNKEGKEKQHGIYKNNDDTKQQHRIYKNKTKELRTIAHTLNKQDRLQQTQRIEHMRTTRSTIEGHIPNNRAKQNKLEQFWAKMNHTDTH